MKILVLDNYDSFTYNLVQMIEQIMAQKVDVFRNDQISLDDVDKYDKIILSPGPGIPKEAGILLEVIKKYAPTKSILGVCLGQQAIAEAFGGSLINLSEIFHGVATEATQIKDHRLFKNLPEKLQVGRYHSWAVNPEDFPEELDQASRDWFRTEFGKGIMIDTPSVGQVLESEDCEAIDFVRSPTSAA